MPFLFKSSSSSSSEARSEQIQNLRDALVTATAQQEVERVNGATVAPVAEILHVQPSLMPECIRYLKATIKDTNPITARVGLHCLDRLMTASGYACQHATKDKILPRLLKIASPKSSSDDLLKRDATRLIHRWAQQYGQDPRLVDFHGASNVLNRKWSKCQTDYTDRPLPHNPGLISDPEPLSHLTPPVLPASEFYQSAIRSSQGIQTGLVTEHLPAPTLTPSQPSRSASSSVQPSKSHVTLEQAGDLLGVLNCMLDNSSPDEPADEVLQDVAKRSRDAKTSITEQIRADPGETALADMLHINDRFTQALSRYDRLPKPRPPPPQYGTPPPAQAPDVPDLLTGPASDRPEDTILSEPIRSPTAPSYDQESAAAAQATWSLTDVLDNINTNAQLAEAEARFCVVVQCCVPILRTRG
mmetsp:Transcript_9396/g.14797  ORF Transcript_9396/g.14797 Transcript_9396/m.14797 type:complete len:415 (+) Transcript_9396:65-1309(+)